MADVPAKRQVDEGDAPGGGRREMPLDEFRALGYLQEVNRHFLHPLGLAIFVIADEDGSNARQMGVQDYRDDPEGCAYDDETLKEPGTETRASYVRMMWDRAAGVRLAHMGWVVQPLAGEEPEETVLIRLDRWASLETIAQNAAAVVALPDNTRPGTVIPGFSEALELLKTSVANLAPDLPRCRMCGCTDEKACEGGCFWKAPDLCSECAGGDPLPPALRAAIEEANNDPTPLIGPD